MLDHALADGRFSSFGRRRGSKTANSGSPLCDSQAITEVLLRFGRGEDPRVTGALDAMSDDLTLEALRAWSWVAPEERPAYLLGVASVLFGVWRTREQTKPYMFGHGYHFKVVKWPTTWCSVLTVLDALGRYPELWSGPDADPADRRSLAERMACLLEYNVAALGSSKGGTGTPRPPRTGR